MWWLAVALGGTLEPDRIAEARAALDRREAAQTAWRQVLDNAGTATGATRRLAMLQSIGLQRKARWEDIAARLDLIAVEGACMRTPLPGCLETMARVGKVNGELVTLEQRQVATFGPDTPAPDPTPLGPPVRERVLPAHDAFCMPDELRRSGRLVIDPASPPDFLTSKGATPAEVATAVEQVRKLVVDWVEASERAGDASLAQEVVCVGLVDDVKGANSMAVGGNWLLVGIRDLYTMYGVHGGDGLGAVEFTVGHELGHILQQKAGMVFPGPTVRGAEVHADCMAGYLMGIAVPPGTTSPAQAYARTEVHRVGDRAVDNPGHHGTPEERTTAFERGWAAGSIAQQGSQGLQQTTTMLKVCSLFAP